VVHFFEVEYTTAVRGLPHSKQLAFNREVINPQDGHILCGSDLATSGFTLRIQRSSRIVNSTMSRPKEMLIGFITRPSWGVLHQTEWADHSLAEKPKMRELQMDWLRSEDLKEEKNVTAPTTIIAVYALCRLPRSTIGHAPNESRYFDADFVYRSLAADVPLREDPDEDDDEEEDSNNQEGDDESTGTRSTGIGSWEPTLFVKSIVLIDPF
jgi:hypothetical protein